MKFEKILNKARQERDKTDIEHAKREDLIMRVYRGFSYQLNMEFGTNTEIKYDRFRESFYLFSDCHHQLSHFFSFKKACYASCHYGKLNLTEMSHKRFSQIFEKTCENLGIERLRLFQDERLIFEKVLKAAHGVEDHDVKLDLAVLPEMKKLAKQWTDEGFDDDVIGARIVELTMTKSGMKNDEHIRQAIELSTDPNLAVSLSCEIFLPNAG